MICQQCQAQLMEESRFCPQCGIPVPEPQVEAAEKVETFDFDTSGEALGYISLQQAALLARRLARETDEIYKERLSWGEVVWTELRSEAVGEDYYRIVLQFRRPARGILEEQTGEEEFLFDVTGVLQDRQVLLWPEGLSASEGEVDTTAMPQLEVSALQPAEPPSGAADTAEVELGTSTTYQTLLQCTQCKTEYTPGQVFCTACGTVISNVSPPSIKPAPSARSDDRPLRTSSPIGRATVASRVRQITGILLGLWSAILLIGGGSDLSEEEQLIWGNLLIMAGGLATVFGAGLLWPQTKVRFGRLGSRWVIIGLVVGGFVAFIVGAVLAAE